MFEINYHSQCNSLHSFHLPRYITSKGNNLYQNFMHKKIATDCIEDKVGVSSKMKSVMPNFFTDFIVEGTNSTDLSSQELVFHLNCFCTNAIAKYFKFGRK